MIEVSIQHNKRVQMTHHVIRRVSYGEGDVDAGRRNECGQKGQSSVQGQHRIVVVTRSKEIKGDASP
jgi:predicted acyltransferase (DUF342 family)